jgi:transposase
MAHTPVKSNREAVKNAWSHGHRTPREISKKTGVPLRSCQRYVAQLKKTGRIPEIHRAGRPRKVSPEMRRQVGRIINGNHFTTAGEIKARLEETHPGFQVGEQTIRDELSRLGYVCSLPRRVPLLSDRAKGNRLQWAQDHAHYNWSKVVFSDETTLQLSRNTCLAWSRSGKPVAPMVKHPFKLHVWGAICARGRVGMCTFTENMDRHLYRQILNENLYDNASSIYGRQRWVFQQDNDPKHTSRDVQADLRLKLPGRVLPWPSYSPDLNPMENIWAILKRIVEKEVKKMVAQKKNVSRDVFVSLVEEGWKRIGDDVILSCIRSMSDRIQACIEAEGGHTKY